jgi:DNA invertase Pin-like site-specific DNA recombinase
VRAALYLRVSTDQQTTANQYQELWAAAARAGWTVLQVYEDAGISGAKGRERRPAFDRLHRAITRREIDVVMAWSVDRLGRSLQDLVAFLGELRAVGCDLYLHQQGVDTTTPAGRALFQMLGVFAEFERAIIVERVRAGIARAKAEGKHCGRPYINGETERAIRAALAAGKGIRKAARECGVGVSVVQRIKGQVTGREIAPAEQIS